MTDTLTDNGLLTNVSSLASRYDVFLLDVWGVLHDGIKRYSGTVDALTKLKEAGKQTCLLSNTPHRSSAIEKHLGELGIERGLYDHILTAGESAYLGLKTRPDEFHKNCGNKCLFLGQDKFVTSDTRDTYFTDLGLEFTADPAEATFILNALGGTEDYDTAPVEEALRQAIAHKLPMVCSNPDIIVNIGDKQYPCAGAFAQKYEEMGGDVRYHGKPHQPIYEIAFNLLGHPPKNKTVAVGDSLHTDIQGANSFGIDSVFNLVGIHWDEVRLENAPEQADMAKLEKFLATQKHKPAKTMAGFKW